MPDPDELDHLAGRERSTIHAGMLDRDDLIGSAVHDDGRADDGLRRRLEQDAPG